MSSSTGRRVEPKGLDHENATQKHSKVSVRTRCRSGVTDRAHSEEARPRRNTGRTCRRDGCQGDGKLVRSNLRTEGDREVDTLSVSSATSNTVAQELSVSSLPPMGTTATTDSNLEDSSFEESGASESQSALLTGNYSNRGLRSGARADGDTKENACGRDVRRR